MSVYLVMKRKKKVSSSLFLYLHVSVIPITKNIYSNGCPVKMTVIKVNMKKILKAVNERSNSNFSPKFSVSDSI